MNKILCGHFGPCGMVERHGVCPVDTHGILCGHDTRLNIDKPIRCNRTFVITKTQLDNVLALVRKFNLEGWTPWFDLIYSNEIGQLTPDMDGMIHREIIILPNDYLTIRFMMKDGSSTWFGLPEILLKKIKDAPREKQDEPPAQSEENGTSADHIITVEDGSLNCGPVFQFGFFPRNKYKDLVFYVKTGEHSNCGLFEMPDTPGNRALMKTLSRAGPSGEES